jgi:hypothetical protein
MSVEHGFITRERDLAAEFLLMHETYKHKPLELTYENEKGEEEKLELSLWEQVKHPITLQTISTNIEMSMTILRKHTTGLRDKGFFEKGKIADKFLPDNVQGGIIFTLEPPKKP